MTTEFLAGDIEFDECGDEGPRTEAYPDPLTGGEPWTIGIGHTGKAIHEGLFWSLDTCIQIYDQDRNAVCQGLDSAIPWWRRDPNPLSHPRQDVLVNMAFQLGVGGLMGFKEFLSALKVGDYTKACNAMLDSKWAHQTPNRAERLAVQMATGERQDPRAFHA